MADLTQITGDLIGENIKNNITTLMKLLNQNVDLNVYHHGIIVQLKIAEMVGGALLTLDRIQIVDNQVKILPPKLVAEPKAKKNGKVETKDVPPLVEQPEEVEV